MSDKKWYEFKLTINYESPKETTISFPADPEDYPPSGVQIHKYLLQQGLCNKAKLRSKIKYLAGDDDVNLENLENLYFKFKGQGAKIERLNDINLKEEYITKTEFERFKAEVKKSLSTIDKELQDLEAEQCDPGLRPDEHLLQEAEQCDPGLRPDEHLLQEAEEQQSQS